MSRSLIIFFLCIIAFIVLCVIAFKDMQTDMEIAGMLFTIMFAIAFIFATLWVFLPKGKTQKF